VPENRGDEMRMSTGRIHCTFLSRVDAGHAAVHPTWRPELRAAGA